MRIFLRFIAISRPQWKWMLAGIVLGVLVISANSLLMAVSGWFIASMAVSGSSGVAFNYFFPSASIRFLAISRTVGRYIERLITHEATFRILAELRTWLFRRIEPLSPAGLERYAGGEVAGRLRADVDSLETYYLKSMAPLAVGGVSIVISLLFLLYFSPPSAAVMFLFLALCSYALPAAVCRLSQKPGKRSTIASAALRNSISEGLRGVEELTLLGVIDRQASRVHELSTQLIVEQERLGRIQGLSLAGITFSAGAAGAAVLLTGTAQIISHQIQPPNLVMLLLFSAAVFEAAGPMSAAFLHLPAAQESASRIFELADSPVPVLDPPNPVDIPVDYSIQFSQVFAGYQSDIPVLKNLNFTVPEGGRLVLCGHSGVGKSLVLEMLLRFRNYAGSILIGRVEIKDMAKDSVRSIISAVPQHPYLFNGTIRENIVLGADPDVPGDLEQILHDCCLDGWIARLPLGLDTPVGAQGEKISGGEGRRIALARSLTKPAPIILLDEPTEGLDAETERELISRLGRRLAASAATVIIISHRPAALSLGTAVLHLP